MPLRRTKRSDGRLRPRWKDGSHLAVENTNADQSQHRVTVDRAIPEPEPLMNVSLLLQRNHENQELTRDRLASAGADARIEESVANGEVRLALLPYGRQEAPSSRCARGRPSTAGAGPSCRVCREPSRESPRRCPPTSGPGPSPWPVSRARRSRLHRRFLPDGAR